MVNVTLDVFDERLHRGEGTAPHGFASEDARSCLDQVQPRGAGGREVKVDIGVCLQPHLHAGRRMGGGVIEHDVQLAPPIATVQPFEETQEVRSRVPSLHSP
jgi:hypothetical protein